MFTNATSVERIMMYVEDGEIEKAEALAQTLNYLEECYSYGIDFV